MNAFDFTVKTQDGKETALSAFKGKVLLIVNTATGCGFTPQYDELQDLYEELKDEGLEILDFPCNQFGAQAPGSDEEIFDFCSSRYGITFPQYSKIDVNGDNAIPLYKWLTENTKFAGFQGPAEEILNPIVEGMDKDFRNNGKIKWNFTKFVITRDGEIAGRFEPTAEISAVKAKIKEVL